MVFVDKQFSSETAFPVSSLTVTVNEKSSGTDCPYIKGSNDNLAATTTIRRSLRDQILHRRMLAVSRTHDSFPEFRQQWRKLSVSSISRIENATLTRAELLTSPSENLTLTGGDK